MAEEEDEEEVTEAPTLDLVGRNLSMGPVTFLAGCCRGGEVTEEAVSARIGSSQI